MNLLDNLALKYGTDKYPWYTPLYHSLLYHRRATVNKVLEIGIGTPSAMRHVEGYMVGASLLMWRDYFSFADIYGFDNDPEAMFSEERIHTTIDRDSLQMTYDLVIDDGSHEVKNQIENFDYFYPMVQTDGLYVIEDVNYADEISAVIDVPHYIMAGVVVGKEAIGKAIVIPK